MVFVLGMYYCHIPTLVRTGILYVTCADCLWKTVWVRTVF